MKTSWSLRLVLTVAALLAAAGCASHEGAYEPVNKPNADLESRANFVLLDARTQKTVTRAGLQERRLEDGRLEVIANIRNRSNQRLEVQVDCVFKDERGFPTQDDAPFQTLILTENAQEGARFVSLNDQARTYTVRVRRTR